MRRRHAVPLAAAVAAALACAGARPAALRSVPTVALTVPPGDRARPPTPGPAPALKLPPQRRFELANGLAVRLVEVHELPIVSLHLVLDAGAVHDPPRQPGLATFTAAMLTEGTKRRSATQISDDLGFIGAALGAGAGFDSAALTGAALTAHLDALLDLFADVLTSPAFPAGDFERVQDQRLVSLLQQRDQPGAVATKAFLRLYWGDHPYGHWPQGDEASVQALQREDLERFHAARWRPRGATLVVVGDVREAELRPRLERALAAWQGAPAPAPVPPPPAPVQLRTQLVAKPGQAPQAYVLMGMPGLDRASPDYAAAQVAYQVLGGGMSSRLFRELREKEGYTYGVYARGEERKLGGTSLIAGSVKAEATGAATRALLRQVAALRQRPVEEAELAVAKNALLLALPGEFATTSGIAAKLGEAVVFGLPDDHWERFEAQVRAVGPDDVLRIARRYLDPAALTTVMVCDPAQVRPQLEGLPLGEIEVRRPAPPAAAPARAKAVGAK